MVAKLYKVLFKSRALDTVPTPQAMWYRYVDDTMTKIYEYAVSSFSEHLNAVDQNIHFTSEEQKRTEEFHSLTPAYM